VPVPNALLNDVAVPLVVNTTKLLSPHINILFAALQLQSIYEIDEYPELIDLRNVYVVPLTVSTWTEPSLYPIPNSAPSFEYLAAMGIAVLLTYVAILAPFI
jgi:hypothetical protein